MINIGPGPKYDLRPVVGYKDHCHSKVREPAYTIGKAKRGQKIPCVGPGPNKYYYQLPGIAGYTIPRAVFKDRKCFSKQAIFFFFIENRTSVFIIYYVSR